MKKDEKSCGSCKWWENSYKGSRIVSHSLGSCEKPYDWNLVPYALQLGMRGWFAVDRRDGTQCPTWQAKKHGKKVRTE